MEITGTIEGNKHLGLTLKIDSIHSELVADMLDKQVVATVKCATPDKIRSVKQEFVYVDLGLLGMKCWL